MTIEYAIKDSNFQEYLKNSISYWSQQLEKWKNSFSLNPIDAFLAGDDNSVFRAAAAHAVYGRVLRMVEGGWGTCKVDHVRDYAMSTVMTVGLNPKRTNSLVNKIIDDYTQAAWVQILSDLRQEAGNFKPKVDENKAEADRLAKVNDFSNKARFHWNPDRPDSSQSWDCEHANENPQGCPCEDYCYCRTRTCKDKRVNTNE